MKIGEKLKQVRKNAKLTQRELAEKCSMSRSYLADLERDRYNPSIDTLQTIANALNISVNIFFEDDSNKNVEEKTAKAEEDIINSFSDEEKMLLEKVKTLSPEKARTILKMIEAFEEENKDK